MLGAFSSALTIGCRDVGYMSAWLAMKVQKVNFYSNRSLSSGLFMPRFSRYQTFLVMDKFQEESLSLQIFARTITEN